MLASSSVGTRFSHIDESNAHTQEKVTCQYETYNHACMATLSLFDQCTELGTSVVQLYYTVCSYTVEPL